jgi:L-amino acid N-acyltransferase YncA
MLDILDMPMQVVDKSGCTYQVRPFLPGERSALEQFYASFEPKRTAQGLPPADAQPIRRWLNEVLPKGLHLLVERDDGGVVGHMMLVPAIGISGCLELATFIHQSVRNRGLGTLLNELAVRIAKAAGMSRIWLSVELSNKAAMKSYENVGFRRTGGSLWAPEVEMEIDLTTPLMRTFS